MSESDLRSYVERYVSTADVVAIYKDLGNSLNSKGLGRCFNCGNDTLYLNRSMNSFRCIRCNDHGDVASFVQRFFKCPFGIALETLDGFQWKNRYAEKDVNTFGAVRDCMTAAAIFFAVKYPAEYLRSRGIDEKVGRQYLIGFNQGKTTLKEHLRDGGFSLETIRLAGLLNQYDQDRFQEHVVIPLRQYGQVFDFYGRYVGTNSEMGKHWRLPSDRLVVGQGYFNWNPNCEEIICVEGVFDALSLFQHGFKNAVATWGTNGLNPAHLKNTNIKHVLMCFDSDKAGRERCIKTAYALQDVGAEVRIIELPDGLDPNDYFLKYSSEDFQGLMKKAKLPEQWSVDNLAPDLDPPAKVAALRDVITRLPAKSLIERAAYVKSIAEKTGLKEKDVKAEVDKRAEEVAEAKTLLNIDEYEHVHPALHFTKDGTTLITVPMLYRNDVTKEVSWEPCVATSQREMFPLTHTELDKRKWYSTHIIYAGRPKYSQGAIEAFRNGRASGDLVKAYFSIKETFKQYADFSDPSTFDYLAAWTVGTYFFPIFNYYPYLHFTGVKEVGKSKVMKMMSQICFNGIMSVSISDSSQFRIITDLLPTLFLDESENLSDKTYSERRAILLGGYERGSEAFRTEKDGDKWRVRQYGNFSPRAFASIQNMDDVLVSRTITIAMMRSFDERIKDAEVTLDDPRFGALRDALFLVAMDYGKKIKAVYEEVKKPSEAEFEAREWNLFKPIYAIGIAVGNNEVLKSLIEFANARYRDKLATYNESAVENVVLQVLLELVQEEKEYALDEIHERLISFTTDKGIFIGSLHKDELGMLLKKLGVVGKKSRPRTESGQRATYYLMNPSTIKDAAKNRSVISQEA